MLIAAAAAAARLIPIAVRLRGGERGHVLVRLRGGRPGRLTLRVLATALMIGAVLTVAGSQPGALGLITGAATWLALTARHDLAPPTPQSNPLPGPAGQD